MTTYQPSHYDLRKAGHQRRELSYATRSIVFNALKLLNAPSSISEITGAVSKNVTVAMSERTVRRAVKELVDTGLFIKGGMKNNAQTYSIAATVYSNPDDDEPAGRLIPFGKDMVNVRDWLRLMADPEGNPLRTQTTQPVLSEAMSNAIRMRMVFTVITAISPGHMQTVATYRNGLERVQAEIEHLLTIVRTFNSSLVWDEAYRDALAFDLREVMRTDPNVYQLALDYIQNLNAKEA